MKRLRIALLASTLLLAVAVLVLLAQGGRCIKETVLFASKHPIVAKRYSLESVSVPVLRDAEYEKLTVIMWTLDSLEKLQTMEEVRAYIERARTGHQELWEHRKATYARWAEAVRDSDEFFRFEYEDGKKSESGYLSLRNGNIAFREVTEGSDISSEGQVGFRGSALKNQEIGR